MIWARCLWSAGCSATPPFLAARFQVVDFRAEMWELPIFPFHDLTRRPSSNSMRLGHCLAMCSSWVEIKKLVAIV